MTEEPTGNTPTTGPSSPIEAIKAIDEMKY